MGQGTLTRVDQLAAEVDAVQEAIVQAVSAATPEQWARVTASERWPVGVVAHHVAEVQRFFAGVLAGLAAEDSEPARSSGAFVDENNARHAAEFANVGKDETLTALRENGAALSQAVRCLDDERLAHVAMTFDGQELSGEQTVMYGVIGHFQEHLESIRETMG